MRGNRFAAADFAQAFVGLRFQINLIDGDTGRFRQRGAHSGEMGPELGPLTNNHGIEMGDPQIFRVCSRNIRLLAFFHLGSVSGKWVPMSPRDAAPNSASQSAWASTSPSE